MPFPDPPDVGGYLVAAWLELGRCGSNGFGEVELPWQEMHAYAGATGALAEPWEFRCIRRMSLDYVTERNNDSSMRIAPYDRKE